MNPLDQLRDEIANLHLLADRLARKSAPYHDLVEAADAMRALFPKAAHDCLLRECSIVDAYDTARARHAEGAQPSGAPYKSWIERCAEFEAATTPEKLSGAPAPSVEEITRIVRDADQDFEGSGGSTRHWVRDCFLPALEKSGLRIVGAPAPASAQGEVCECGHGRAMHFDEDGDHNGACLYQMNDKPFCRCDMFRAKDKERA